MQVASAEWLWGLLIIGLGIGIAYGIIQTRHRTPGKKRIRDEGTKRVYEEENKKPQP